MGVDTCSFIAQGSVYKAKGQSQVLPVESENTADSPCLCQWLTNKKGKQNQCRDPKGDEQQTISDEDSFPGEEHQAGFCSFKLRWKAHAFGRVTLDFKPHLL